MNKTFPPEFCELMIQYRDTAASLGDDHPLARRLLLLAIKTAPAWFLDQMHDMARSMGVLPEAFGCDGSGQRFYALDDVAANLGMTADEAVQKMTMLKVDAVAAGLPHMLQAADLGDLHRLH